VGVEDRERQQEDEEVLWHQVQEGAVGHVLQWEAEGVAKPRSEVEIELQHDEIYHS